LFVYKGLYGVGFEDTFLFEDKVVSSIGEITGSKASTKIKKFSFEARGGVFPL